MRLLRPLVARHIYRSLIVFGFLGLSFFGKSIGASSVSASWASRSSAYLLQPHRVRFLGPFVVQHIYCSLIVFGFLGLSLFGIFSGASSGSAFWASRSSAYLLQPLRIRLLGPLDVRHIGTRIEHGLLIVFGSSGDILFIWCKFEYSAVSSLWAVGFISSLLL